MSFDPELRYARVINLGTQTRDPISCLVVSECE